MQLYNTLSRQLTAIQPLKFPTVTIYTCGPTVYDFPHVGNWFTFVRYDLLVRTLQASGYTPQWVMNITDVGHLVSDADEGEDKLEKGARREGKTAWDVAAYYGEYFINGLTRLNFTQPTYLPKATEHIQEQIDLVTQLETRGFTYSISDGVYYDTSKFPRYADFALLDLDEQQAGARVEFNAEKRNASDFALWKFSPKGQARDMEWDSPWGRGFPGWHIECSAMGMKYLGETLDIHAGGIDHVPVHHTNEIAQSEAVTGKPFATVWMHTNHISVEGEKISKSLAHTMITLEDIEAHDISLEAFRLHVLESHYRSQSKFSWASMEAAHNRLRNFREVAALRFQPLAQSDTLSTDEFDASFQTILGHLQNDLDTPSALAELNRLLDQVLASRLSAESLGSFSAYLRNIDNVLGLQLLSGTDIDAAQKHLIADREHARESKDWATSDRIRDELTKQGIGLRDTPHGTTWYYL